MHKFRHGFLLLSLLFLTGCAGTRFTEMLWAVGTEADYLMFPAHGENILYRSGEEYFLKCEKRTYQEQPGYFQLLALPVGFQPNHYKFLRTAPQPFFVKLAPEAAKKMNGKNTIREKFLLYEGTIEEKLPFDAVLSPSPVRYIPPPLQDRILLDGVLEFIEGRKTAKRKSGESFLLLPLMLPTLCIDIATHLLWPLNLPLGMIALKYEVKKRQLPEDAIAPR